jgi:hypothetical protein
MAGINSGRSSRRMEIIIRNLILMIAIILMMYDTYKFGYREPTDFESKQALDQKRQLA